MKQKLIRILKIVIRSLGLGHLLHRPRIPHGPEGIRAAGHRRYIGGMWEEIGKLQYEFLVSRGLRPDHVFCDVACGSLRAGVHLIPYLDKGHYLGIDKEQDLIDAGLRKELTAETVENKQPEFVVSSEFEFERFTKQPNMAIAQSLFTHLPPQVIRLCLAKLFPKMAPNGEFYGTFFKNDGTHANPTEAHDHGFFAYAEEEMLEFGTAEGWKAEYIGDWQHPRHQVMVVYRKP